MLSGIAQKIPLVGPIIRSIRRRISQEGAIQQIKHGPLEGLSYHRYQWSTPNEGLVEDNWADQMPGIFVREIPAKKRFFDIGANWGFYVLLAHKHRDPGCQIVAFEPHPRTADELRTQITLNHIDHAEVLQAALSDQVGTIEFADTGSAIGQKLAAVNDSHPQARNIVVPTLTLDEAAHRFGPPDICKIDVEGAENMVLKGAAEVLGVHRPVLLMEIHGAENSVPFYQIMSQYGYRCWTMEGAEVTDGAYHHHLVCRHQG